MGWILSEAGLEAFDGHGDLGGAIHGTFARELGQGQGCGVASHGEREIAANVSMAVAEVKPAFAAGFFNGGDDLLESDGFLRPSRRAAGGSVCQPEAGFNGFAQVCNESASAEDNVFVEVFPWGGLAALSQLVLDVAAVFGVAFGCGAAAKFEN